MTNPLRFTIRFEDAGDGWFVAQVNEVPGAISQGESREEARENVIDALTLMLSAEPEEAIDPSERIELTLVP